MATAAENLTAAELLFDAGQARSSSSRAYYACFAWTHAILLRLSLDPPAQGNWPNPRLPALLSSTLQARASFVPPYAVTMLRNHLLRCWTNRLLADYRPVPFASEVAKDSLASARRFGYFARKVLS